MAASRATKVTAVVLSLASALCWAVYYPFVLWATPAATPSAILVYPFLFGGLALAGWSVARGHGKEFLALWWSPGAYARVGLLVGMQISVLASTYLAGPVDTSLLSFLGDVVLTPLAVALLFHIHRDQIGSPLFAVGLALCLAGGTLAIVGGERLAAVPPLGWVVVPLVPLFVAFFFLQTARANRTVPASAVVSQSSVAAALVLAVAAPLLPGGWAGLGHVPPIPLVLLLATGLSSFFLAEAFYFDAIERVGLVLPPMLMTAIPVFTLILSATLLGVGIPPLGALGIPLTIGGALCIFGGETRNDPGTIGPEPVGP